MTDEMIITGYALNKSGYIKEDGTEIFSEQVKTAASKQALINYAKRNNLDVDEYYINSIGYEMLEGGIRVPAEGEEYDYLHNYLPRK